jgi:hypothetical protein
VIRDHPTAWKYALGRNVANIRSWVPCELRFISDAQDLNEVECDIIRGMNNEDNLMTTQCRWRVGEIQSVLVVDMSTRL